MKTNWRNILIGAATLLALFVLYQRTMTEGFAGGIAGKLTDAAPGSQNDRLQPTADSARIGAILGGIIGGIFIIGFILLYFYEKRRAQ